MTDYFSELIEPHFWSAVKARLRTQVRGKRSIKAGLCCHPWSGSAGAQTCRRDPMRTASRGLRGVLQPTDNRNMDLTATVKSLRNALAPYGNGIACAYLFGSWARGEARRDSDVDLAVLYRSEPPSTLDGLGLELAAAVEAATGRSADIVVLNRAAPDLVHRILRDGVLVLETDRSARIGFEVRSRAEYFDVLPYLREYRRSTGVRHDRP
jgi:uncharacterized protein